MGGGLLRELAQHKAEGNRHFKAGDWSAAAVAYGEGISLAGGGDSDSSDEEGVASPALARLDAEWETKNAAQEAEHQRALAACAAAGEAAAAAAAEGAGADTAEQGSLKLAEAVAAHAEALLDQRRVHAAAAAQLTTEWDARLATGGVVIVVHSCSLCFVRSIGCAARCERSRAARK